MLRVSQLSGFGIGSGEITRGRVLTGSGSYVLVGNAAGVVKTSPTNKILNAAAGAYSLTGTAATLTKTSAGPPGVTGLIGWWDASVTASFSLTGSDINSVADQSGAGNTLSDIGFGAKTAYNATGLNSLPTIDFWQDTQGGLQKNSFAFGTGNTLTAFFVGQFEPSGGAASERAMSYFAGGAHDYDNNASFCIAQNASSTNMDFVRNSVILAQRNFGTHATPHRCICTIDSSGNTKNYIDGVATTGSTSNAAFGASGNFRLGQADNATGNCRWHGSISEAGIATGFSNSTDVATLDTWLKTKWGL